MRLKPYYLTMRNLFFYLIFLLTLVSCSTNEENNSSVKNKILEIKGADVSFLPEIRQSGLIFYNQNNQPEDMLLTLKKSGVNAIRLRIWKNPSEANSSFETVKNLIAEIKSIGLKTIITVHYSDSWADPSKQTKPFQWQGLNFMQLKDSVYLYTKKIMNEINPEYIQLGNEINNGFLWPEGSI
jgi:arabinogalactan endo-1,4-beta-galactosidase